MDDKEFLAQLKKNFSKLGKMKHNNSYIYPKTVRTEIDGKRHYDIDGGKWKLPSVTTILICHTDSREARIVSKGGVNERELKMQRGSWSNQVPEVQRCTRYLKSIC